MKNEGVLHTVAMSMYQVAITWGVPIEPALLLLAKSDHRPSCNYLTIRALSPRYHPVNNLNSHESFGHQSSNDFPINNI